MLARPSITMVSAVMKVPVRLDNLLKPHIWMAACAPGVTVALPEQVGPRSHHIAARFCFHKLGPERNGCITAWSTLKQPYF